MGYGAVTGLAGPAGDAPVTRLTLPEGRRGQAGDEQRRGAGAESKHEGGRPARPRASGAPDQSYSPVVLSRRPLVRVRRMSSEMPMTDRPIMMMASLSSASTSPA